MKPEWIIPNSKIYQSVVSGLKKKMSYPQTYQVNNYVEMNFDMKSKVIPEEK